MGGVCWAYAGFGTDSPWVSSAAWLGLVVGALAATTLLKKRQARAWAAAGVALAELGFFQLTVHQDIFAAAPPCPEVPLLQEPGRVLFDLGADNTPTVANHTALCELGLANRNQLSHTLEVNGFVVPGPGKMRTLMRTDVHAAFELFHPATLVVSEQTDRSRYPAGTEVMKRGIYTALHVGPPVRALWRSWGAGQPLDPVSTDVDSLNFDLPGAAGTLRVLDTYFPGWVAQVDGQDVPIVDVDGVREVHVPVGAQHLRMQYDPDTVRWGLLTSALGLILLGLLATDWRPSVS